MTAIMEHYTNMVKDNYLWLIDALEAHPHRTFWLWPATVLLAAWVL
jgi:hypothetical protein